jgi:hypothetical protein
MTCKIPKTSSQLSARNSSLCSPVLQCALPRENRKLYCTTRKLLSSQIVKRKKYLEGIKVLVNKRRKGMVFKEIVSKTDIYCKLTEN